MPDRTFSQFQSRLSSFLLHKKFVDYRFSEIFRQVNYWTNTFTRPSLSQFPSPKFVSVTEINIETSKIAKSPVGNVLFCPTTHLPSCGWCLRRGRGRRCFRCRSSCWRTCSTSCSFARTGSSSSSDSFSCCWCWSCDSCSGGRSCCAAAAAAVQVLPLRVERLAGVTLHLLLVDLLHVLVVVLLLELPEEKREREKRWSKEKESRNREESKESRYKRERSLVEYNRPAKGSQNISLFFAYLLHVEAL